MLALQHNNAPIGVLREVGRAVLPYDGAPPPRRRLEVDPETGDRIMEWVAAAAVAGTIVAKLLGWL